MSNVGQSGGKWGREMDLILNRLVTRENYETIVLVKQEMEELLAHAEANSMLLVLNEIDQVVQSKGQPDYWPRFKVELRSTYDF